MREWLLLAVSTVASVALGLGLLRWAAPQLLGGPPDLRIVRASEEVTPFYENALGNVEGDDFVLNDPYTLVRMRPLVSADERAGGPTDLLGFRNLAVPNRADVVVIGDSQTYGINVAFEESWPRRLSAALAPGGTLVYSMATGGWGAVQYLDMFEKALAFEPRVIVVAYYSGNDAAESFRLAYGVDHWADLRPDASLGLDDRPPRGDLERTNVWLAELPDGSGVIFAPWVRLYAIRRNPVNDAGWEIMAEVARRMARLAVAHDVAVIFTIIPTKELVYAASLRDRGVELHADHLELARLERLRIAELAGRLRELGEYVDVAAALEDSLRRGVETHPRGNQGHPNAAGYLRIARELEPPVRSHLR